MAGARGRSAAITVLGDLTCGGGVGGLRQPPGEVGELRPKLAAAAAGKKPPIWARRDGWKGKAAGLMAPAAAAAAKAGCWLMRAAAAELDVGTLAALAASLLLPLWSGLGEGDMSRPLDLGTAALDWEAELPLAAAAAARAAAANLSRWAAAAAAAAWFSMGGDLEEEEEELLLSSASPGAAAATSLGGGGKSWCKEETTAVGADEDCAAAEA